MTAILPLPNQSVRHHGGQSFSTHSGHEKDHPQAQAARVFANPIASALASQRAARVSGGFHDTIQVSEASLATYAKDAGLSLPLAHFSNPEQAAKYLQDLLARMVTSAEKIKVLVQARQDLTRPVNMQDEAQVAQMHALQVGQQLAAEKDLQRLSAALAKAFDIDRPIYRQEGGAVSFNPTDFSFAGRLLAQLMPDGRAAMLIEEEKQGLRGFGAVVQPFVGHSTWSPAAGFAPGLVMVSLVMLVFWLMF